MREDLYWKVFKAIWGRDPADDGPEVLLIKFFTAFPHGARAIRAGQVVGPFELWVWLGLV